MVSLGHSMSHDLHITKSRDGEPLAYRVLGPAGRTPLLTVHGLVSSDHHWKFLTPRYASERPVVSWEYRGHGGQPAPRDHRTASVPQFADDAHAVWSASGVGPAIVVALSFGVFALYAVALPWLGFRLATLLFVGGSNALLDPPRGVRGWLRALALAVVTTLLTWLVFERWLSVLLPRGRWTGF